MKKVLLVAMADSVHTGRWIRQFDDDSIEFLLFPSTPHRRIHSLIKERRDKSGSSRFGISKWMTFGALPIGITDLMCSNFFRGKLLSHEIKRFKPDVIHIMETQHGGYLVDRAVRVKLTPPKIVLSIWGSDIYWFQRFPRHQSKIRSILTKVDLLVMECRRDQELALSLGYSGKFHQVMPATGGMNTSLLGQRAKIVSPKDRKLIAVKGYSGFVGLGKDAVRVIENIEDKIKDFSVTVYSAGIGTMWFSRRLKKKMGTRLVIARKHTLSNSEIEQMFLNSRVALGLSLSDGLPATVKESMCMGAFPIQTSTSCADEWFLDGISGLIVPPNDISATSAAVLRVLRDDQLVESAMKINLMESEKLFSNKRLKEIASTVYSLLDEASR